MSENEIRAAAVLEAARYIDGKYQHGLVPLGNVLADLKAVAYRMEQGMTAGGATRVTTDQSIGGGDA